MIRNIHSHKITATSEHINIRQRHRDVDDGDPQTARILRDRKQMLQDSAGWKNVPGLPWARKREAEIKMYFTVMYCIYCVSSGKNNLPEMCFESKSHDTVK